MRRTRLDRLPVCVLPGGQRLYDARTVRARARGLAGLRSLAPTAALRLAPCRSVHTFGMRFALDLIWLDADGAVLGLARDVPPRRLRLNRRARAVIEAPAGQGERFVAALAMRS